MSKGKELLKKALIEMEEIRLNEDFMLLASHIKQGSTIKLYIDNESYTKFIGALKYELLDYTIFTNWQTNLSGICKMALISKDKTHEIKLDEVCYKIIIE